MANVAEGATPCGERGTQRKLQTRGTAEEHKRQETPTINPIDRPPTQLTDQAPSTIERAARERRNTNQLSRRERLLHSNNLPSSPSPNRVITISSQPTHPAAKPRSNTQAGWAALHHRHHPHQGGHAAPTTGWRGGRGGEGVGGRGRG